MVSSGQGAEQVLFLLESLCLLDLQVEGLEIGDHHIPST